MSPSDQKKLRELEAENIRLRAGLELIQNNGAIHGGGWCVMQARGYLEDLDFDEFPEDGKTK